MALSAETTDKDLVQQARQGNGDAITLLVKRYSPQLFRFLTRTTGQPDLAEDLLQDTWLRVMEKLDRYHTDKPFAPWLYTVARNLAIDKLRRLGRQGKKAEPRLTEDGALDDPVELAADSAPSALENLEKQNLLEHVERTLAGLPFELREVLTLRFQEELQLEEIAQVVGLPSSTVKSRLYRGLEQLRLRVERIR